MLCIKRVRLYYSDAEPNHDTMLYVTKIKEIIILKTILTKKAVLISFIHSYT